jgi:hypothetical protein
MRMRTESARLPSPQAGYTALPEYALDDDVTTYWSSTGGAVCCSESAPAWLMVSLGARRPVAALQLLYVFDMTYTLSLANASDGPFVTVTTRMCVECRMNDFSLPLAVETFWLPLTVTASFVKMTVTWSTAGGVGGCADLCDWACDVYDFRVLSPGALPPAAHVPRPLEAADVLGPGCDAPTVTLVEQLPSGAGATLSGGAALLARGAGHAPDAGAVALTGSASASFGAVEFNRVIRPAQDCRCEALHMLALTAYVKMGGGVLPGEGLAISLVDATKQTPGATLFMPGCGMRAALPVHAMSIVFDTAVSDATCDEPGTGGRVVSTLGGEDAPPRVLSSTLEQGTTRFRRGEWTAVQFGIKNPLVHMDFTTGQVQLSDSDAEPGQDDGLLRYAPWRVWVDGSALLDPSGLPINLMRNATLSEFYIVVSARTGGAALDAHAVSGMHLECLWHVGTEDASRPTFNEWIVNWDGTRQPLTPPPFARPPPPANASAPGAARMPPPPSSRRSSSSSSSSSTMGAAAAGAASAAAAFGATLALLCLAAAAWHHCSLVPHSQEEEEEAAQHELPLLQPPHAAPPAAHEPAFHAFLSYRRADWRIVDAVQDKLRLAGLRVFKDVDGAMTGRPFDVELLLAVRSAPVFAPVITLFSLQRMAGAAASPSEVDTSLAEWLAALYFRDAEEETAEDGTRPVRLIHPLLVGTLLPPCDGFPSRWSSLAAEPAYTAALAALPLAVPTATVAMVDGALRRALGRPLPPRFTCLTVRDIVLGRAAPPLVGILSGSPFALECADEDLGLYIRGKFAPALLHGSAR